MSPLVACRRKLRPGLRSGGGGSGLRQARRFLPSVGPPQKERRFWKGRHWPPGLHRCRARRSVSEIALFVVGPSASRRTRCLMPTGFAISCLRSSVAQRTRSVDSARSPHASCRRSRVGARPVRPRRRPARRPRLPGALGIGGLPNRRQRPQRPRRLRAAKRQRPHGRRVRPAVVQRPASRERRCASAGGRRRPADKRNVEGGAPWVGGGVVVRHRRCQLRCAI